MHEEEMSKILVYLKGFTEDERLRLAQITALWLASGQIPASTLRVLINVRVYLSIFPPFATFWWKLFHWFSPWYFVYRPEFILTIIDLLIENSQTNFAKFFQEHQVKDGLALNFFLDILTTLKAEKGSAAVTTTIKKSGLDSRLMEFFPPINQQQTEENFAKTFQEKNLDEVVNFRKQYAANTNRNVVYKLIKEAIEDEKTPKEIIIEIRDINDKNNISEQDTLIMVIF